MPEFSRSRSTAEGPPLWEPSDDQVARANITRYLHRLKTRKGLHFRSYEELWNWSVNDLEAFWASVWEFFEIRASTPFSQVLAERRMPGARWFTGAHLNYAEHALRRRDGHRALMFRAEASPLVALTYAELYGQTAAVAAALRRMGVQRGDRVVAYLPNSPQAVVAFLATASLGAIWSSCSPEFGTSSVVDRFKQIEPRVLFAVDGYQYNGKGYDRRDAVSAIRRQLPSLEWTIAVPHLSPGLPLPADAAWDEMLRSKDELAFEPVPFDHPLWILYSSGTTGLPKPIVQGHGGILLEHLKALSLHHDLKPDDRFFWYTTTGWMMWNLLISGLLLGSTVVLYDGSPAYPDLGALWRFAEEARITYFGTSAPFLQNCMKAGLEPNRECDLGRLRAVGSTASPLPPEGFRWVYERVKSDVLLASVSGGTDICTAVVGSCPLLPVHAGEIQCRMLGAKVEAYSEEGRSLTEEVGELVITRPLPSMPLFFWGDRDGNRYRESYFEQFPGVWRHGDWIKITRRGSCVIYGRSDSTLNRGGVRMGTSDFYRVVEALPEIADSLVVDTSQLNQEGRLLLFVVVEKGCRLDGGLKARIREKLRAELSPRHIPDAIYAISEVPRTLNGKKMEVPVKRILTGVPVDRAISTSAMSNPDSIAPFVELASSPAGATV